MSPLPVSGFSALQADNVAGRTPLPSSLDPEGLVPAGANISGVSNNQNIPQQNIKINRYKQAIPSTSRNKFLNPTPSAELRP